MPRGIEETNSEHALGVLMDYGVIFLSHVGVASEVALAEQQGYSHAWFGDSQMVWSDVYQCMALCTAHTSTIKLGTNVTNPSTRIAPMTACSFGMLNALAPGRVIMGIGTGNTARRTLGMPAARIDTMRQHIDTCRGLWNRETVPYVEGQRERKIKFLNPDGPFINLNHSIPVHVAGSGPKTLEFAGESGDGVILFGTVGDGLLEYALGHIRSGAERAGKTLDDVYITVVTAVHFQKPEESLADLQAIVGPLVVSECNIFALSVKDPTELPEDIRNPILAFREAYRTPDASIETRHLELYTDYCAVFKPEHADLVTEQMIKETTLTGSTAEIRERINAMAGFGVNQVSIAGGPDDVAAFAREILG